MTGYGGQKRAFDLATALFVGVALLPAFLLVAVLIRATSPGPALYRQIRVGRAGRPFRIVKFRTMTDAGSITPLGRILRRHRLDELPQVFNIIRGEMSWIGPRPEAEALAALYANHLPGYHERHSVRPGLTGWAQINQGHVTGVEAAAIKLALDRFYLDNLSPGIDFLIAVKTIPVVLSGAGR